MWDSRCIDSILSSCTSLKPPTKKKRKVHPQMMIWQRTVSVPRLFSIYVETKNFCLICFVLFFSLSRVTVDIRNEKLLLIQSSQICTYQSFLTQGLRASFFFFFYCSVSSSHWPYIIPVSYTAACVCTPKKKKTCTHPTNLCRAPTCLPQFNSAFLVALSLVPSFLSAPCSLAPNTEESKFSPPPFLKTSCLTVTPQSSLKNTFHN